jgi:hypothetical protein
MSSLLLPANIADLAVYPDVGPQYIQAKKPPHAAGFGPTMLQYNHGEKLSTPEEGILDLHRAIGKLHGNLLDVSSHNLSTPINRDFVEFFEGGVEVMCPSTLATACSRGALVPVVPSEASRG